MVGTPSWRVITWEEVVEGLRDSSLQDDARADLEQLADFIEYVDSQFVQPFTPEEVGERWATRRHAIEILAKQLSYDLYATLNARSGFASSSVPPWQAERSDRPDGSFRYVRVFGDVHVGIGLFVTELPQGNPFAIRYHSTTPGLRQVTERLLASSLDVTTGGTEKHVFVRLRIPPETSQHAMLRSLSGQIAETLSIAHPDMLSLGEFSTAPTPTDLPEVG